jgi:hypothetical protein
MARYFINLIRLWPLPEFVLPRVLSQDCRYAINLLENIFRKDGQRKRERKTTAIYLLTDKKGTHTRDKA